MSFVKRRGAGPNTSATLQKILAAVAIAVGCGIANCPAAFGAVPLSAAQPGNPTASEWPDVQSYAQPDSFVTRHLDLDWNIDFANHAVRGTVILDVERRDAAAQTLVLDTSDLAISSVQAAMAGSNDFSTTKFSLAPPDRLLGSALRISMPPGATRVRIAYVAPDASGLQWLAPAQTAGKRKPFVYSQAQSIAARSFVPLQDTPRVRATFTARLTVPAGMVAVMAAEAISSNTRGATVFRFDMPQPIPSYLIAFAVGDLAFKATGTRTGVWAEPTVLDAAARELEDAETMLRKSEALYGNYQWGRYDVLVLPPAFPFGGMENPRLTFMTPTIITGDKSLVGVLAHELAHSWSGNLVTNATWRDGWLNESFTTYFERRIMQAVYGSGRAQMEWGIGLQAFERALRELPAAEQWRAQLAPDLAPHPDFEGGTMAIEKGALFLYQLEVRFGRGKLDAFLARWFDEHAFTSVTTPQFVAQLQRDLLDRDPVKADMEFVRGWLEGTEIPADAVFVRSVAFDRVEAQRKEWESGAKSAAQLDTAAWSVQEWLYFLDHIARPQSKSQLAALDRRFQFTSSHNAELQCSWFRLALASGYEPIQPALEKYLTTIGRNKLVYPLYLDLMKTTAGAQTARRIYAVARPGYHAVVQRGVDRLMMAQEAAH